jgi:hypothetical protein
MKRFFSVEVFIRWGREADDDNDAPNSASGSFESLCILHLCVIHEMG